MSDGSDIEIQSALPKKILPKKNMPKQPKSPTAEHLPNEPKKISTKVMIHEALNELKSRKGTSLYAIKKFIAEKHQVDTEKLNYIIKKLIKTGVESGTIVQTKGVGASGSFKLAPQKPEKKKPKPKTAGKKKEKSKDTKSTEAKSKSKEVEKVGKTMDKPKKPASEKMDTETKSKEKKNNANKVKKAATPAKKRAAMMKRKSIGSIIKPPKMKPKGKN